MEKVGLQKSRERLWVEYLVETDVEVEERVGDRSGVGLVRGREKECGLKVHFFWNLLFECNLRVAAFTT